MKNSGFNRIENVRLNGSRNNKCVILRAARTDKTGGVYDATAWDHDDWQ